MRWSRPMQAKQTQIPSEASSPSPLHGLCVQGYGGTGVLIPVRDATPCVHDQGVPGKKRKQPAKTVYSDLNGIVPVTQSLTYDVGGNPVIASLTTDGLGHAAFYAAAGSTVTVAVYVQKPIAIFSAGSTDRVKANLRTTSLKFRSAYPAVNGFASGLPPFPDRYCGALLWEGQWDPCVPQCV